MAAFSGPIGEICGLVMRAISRPDGLDLSVQDVPFNWNADLDVGRFRVGYLEDAFDEIDLEDLRALGLRLTPIEIPEWSINVRAHGVEMAVFFDELVRSGRAELLGRQNRADSFRAARMIPAVEYLQSQRARMMMMMQLAEATSGVDVYVIPRRPRRGGAGGGGGATGASPNQPQPYSAGRNASSMANYACHPALAVPIGFNDEGLPASLTFFAKPFGESELLAVAKAYQDATRHHLKHPDLGG